MITSKHLDNYTYILRGVFYSYGCMYYAEKTLSFQNWGEIPR